MRSGAAAVSTLATARIAQAAAHRQRVGGVELRVVAAPTAAAMPPWAQRLEPRPARSW